MIENDEKYIYKLIEKVLGNYYKTLTEKVSNFDEKLNDFYKISKELKEKIEPLEKSIFAHSIGVQNVYNEVNKVRKNLDIMKSLKDRLEEETIPIDEVELTLRVKSYPMNIRVNMNIETNFGEISYIYDYPPFNEDKLSESINKVYLNLLNELYEEHEKKGGKFMGDEGCKEWFDKNGKTKIIKDSCLIKRQ